VVQAGGGLGGAIGPFLGLAFLTAAGAVAGSGVAAWVLAALPMERGRGSNPETKEDYP
jgi:hypothetical protein